MNRRVRLAPVTAGFAFATFAAASSSVSAQVVTGIEVGTPDTATINVTGLGEILVRPARAVVFLEVVSEAASVGAAALANDALRSRVREALAKIGFTEEQVSLWGYGAGSANPRLRVAAPG